ncbi:hypothetical protein BK767_26315 [Bacillus thuringiensis serovar kyushuensis]|uniref:restriction endonuclease n=1 Tax=Bacillus thuringiensis TaxID=1428 RepID=UPI000B435DFB|nr:restriction endonuclease [Bacillus thuringiensis]MEC2861581.1 restriction endonuclease [Bacillus cereus]OTZ63547.1 hypothetical protein BK767_26315 [Bacillus thuringiensis serovar kyushuensis]OTZ73990.1 hypothetical protein BK768_14735 [Bacillus thuringiensis serovar tohokuensis]OUB82666.1 hypothetical protein BK773_25890 [Bacillus thuringiensis serovar indiana]
MPTRPNYNDVGQLSLTKSSVEQLRLLRIQFENSGLSEESFVELLLKKAGYMPHILNKKRTSNDDGVDFIIEVFNFVIICQLKWWFHTKVHKKQAKQIFGEMYLNESVDKIKQNDKEIRFALIVPYVGQNIWKQLSLFEKNKFFLITEEKFIRFLTNPSYFLEHYFKEEIL